MQPFTDERLTEVLNAYAEYDSQEDTAQALGITRSAVQRMLRRASERGLVGVQSLAGKGVPEGYYVKGTSTLYGKDGQVTAEWVKTQRELNLDDMVQALSDTFAEYKGLALLPPRSAGLLHHDLATVYPVADLHLGMYSWFEETGADYDMAIASDLLLKAMGELVSLSPSSEVGVVLNLGDFYHSDSNENRTRRSGNALDVDTRYAKVLQTGVQLLIATTQLALQKHKTVLVRNLQGNHDPYAALALGIALDAYFKGSDRVTVDINPSPFFFWKWGKVLIGATHGDMVKAQDMPGVMAAKMAKEWGETEHRYIYTGHLHSQQKALVKPGAGAQVEVFETLAPRDAWGNSMGFVSGRSMTAIVLHKETGERTRFTHNVEGPR